MPPPSAAGGPRTLTVRPRLQRETWSLYWREAMATQTTCAEDVALPIGGGKAAAAAADEGQAAAPRPPPLPEDATVRDALRAAAAALGWPPVGSLVRLEGFEAPFERCLCRGVEVGLDEPAAKYAAAAEGRRGEEDEEEGGGGGAGGAAVRKPPPALVYVRTVLAAEGWRLANDPENDPDGYSTSDSDEEEDD
jgi:hypothetical protein